ncbi:AraC family transcriptional regulator [Alteromonas sediminis]|uniref:AraC family transcriptional regulator n=1 Tax=Alteromonas sediminis TaxID=2259342 RepID=A0A3N5ZEH4_9ALTE|nr:AraC family transcriptional regulator [Alteromonas sediminis]RPJ68798.1 AraC family transcriptional regulator [Alteromonas sediminis]
MGLNDVYTAALFFFSALGVFNGVLLTVFARAWFDDRVSSLLFGLLFLALSIRIGKTVALYFFPGLSIWIIQLGLTACIFIGPLLYLYTLYQRTKRLNFLNLIHLVTPIVVMLVVGIVFPFAAYPETWKNAHKVIYHYWLIYLIFAALEVNKIIKISQWKTTTIKHPHFLLINIFISNSLIWFSYYSFKYTSVIAGAMTFSIVTYILILISFTHYLKYKRISKQSVKKKDIEEHKMPNVHADELELMINQIMRQDKRFTEANLTLPKTAKLLQTTPHKLSYYLNNAKGIKFTDWLNTYRIKEAQRLLCLDKKMTIDVIAETCGYNSTSNFYSEFKKATGVTPSFYRKQQKESHSEADKLNREV